jgi:hydrogenase maturation protease
VTTFVGGVGELYQGDLDLGRRAVERLAGRDLGGDVLIEELHYGAVAVAQRLEEVRPEALVLVGAQRRGRPPGTVERRRIVDLRPDPSAVQASVGDAVTGYVSIDLVLDVAAGFGVLPARTIVYEVEPALVEPGDAMSAAAEAALEQVVDLAVAEVQRAPLLGLADQLRSLVADGHLEQGGAALAALQDLLAALDTIDREGRWARTFAERDRLRLEISRGATAEGMTHLDWGLWWTLIEELDRLQGAELAG